MSVDADCAHDQLPHACSYCVALQTSGVGATISSCAIWRVVDGRELEDAVAGGSRKGSPKLLRNGGASPASVFSDRTGDFMQRLAAFGIHTKRRDNEDMTA